MCAFLMADRRNRIKITLQQQLFMLLEEMKKCPWLGKGAPTIVNKRKWDEEWDRVRGILNGVGPPMRSTSEWKKIWGDLRRKARKRLEEKLDVKANGEDPHTTAFTHMEKEVAQMLGFSKNRESLRESFIAGKAQKRTHDKISSDGALAEFQFVSAPNPLSPVHIKPCTAVSKISSTSASNAAISSVSAAVFKAVSAAASRIASTAALTDASTAKPDVSNPKRRKDHNDECLELLRQQVAHQQNIRKSLDRIANAVELYVGESRTRQAEAAVTDIPLPL